jgi:hypothetical protein
MLGPRSKKEFIASLTEPFNKRMVAVTAVLDSSLSGYPKMSPGRSQYGLVHRLVAPVILIHKSLGPSVRMLAMYIVNFVNAPNGRELKFPLDPIVVIAKALERSIVSSVGRFEILAYNLHSSLYSGVIMPLQLAQRVVDSEELGVADCVFLAIH